MFLIGTLIVFIFRERSAQNEKFTILFCEFSEAASEEVPKDRHIAYYVYNDLRKKFQGSNIVIVKVDDVIVDEERALQLGRNFEAVAVIYGIYTKVQTRIKLDLRFLVIRKPKYYQPIDTEKKALPIEELDSGKLETLIGHNYANITKFLIGLFEYSSGNYKSAIETFLSLAEDVPVNQNLNSLKPDVIYLYLGNSYYLLEDINASKAAFEKAIRIKPENPKVVHNIGVIEYQTRNFQNSINYFTNALTLDKGLIVAYRNRAFVLMQQEKYEQALEDLKIYLSNGSYNWVDLRLTAIAYSNTGNHSESIRYFKLAINKGRRKNISLMIELADEYILDGNHSKALMTLISQLYRWNYFSTLMGHIGDIFKNLKRIRLAEYCYTMALLINKRNHYLFFSRSNVRLAIGDIVGAKKDLERAIKLEPKFSDAYFNLANIEQQKGFLVEAESHYSNVISISPEFSDAYFNRALVRFQLKMFDGAVSDCKQYEELEVERGFDIYKVLGYSLIELFSFTEAIKVFRALYKKFPSNENRKHFALARLLRAKFLVDTHKKLSKVSHHEK